MPIPMPCSETGCKRTCKTTLADQFPATAELGAWYEVTCSEHGWDGYVSQKHWTYYVATQERLESERLARLERAKKAGK